MIRDLNVVELECPAPVLDLIMCAPVARQRLDTGFTTRFELSVPNLSAPRPLVQIVAFHTYPKSRPCSTKSFSETAHYKLYCRIVSAPLHTRTVS